jgi:hypothetical protein
VFHELPGIVPKPHEVRLRNVRPCSRGGRSFVRIIRLPQDGLLNACGAKSEDSIDRNELPKSCELASIDTLRLFTEEHVLSQRGDESLN